jgi:hypothetical protein
MSLKAQKITGIWLLESGKSADLMVQIDQTTVIMNTNGKLLGINTLNSDKITSHTGWITYDSDSDIDYHNPESISLNREITYYNDFQDYNSGKLKSVGDVTFKYNDGFKTYLKGKLDQIGNLKITYYDDFHPYQSGKIKSIGSINFTYHDDFYTYKTGKLKSIKGNADRIKIAVSNY